MESYELKRIAMIIESSTDCYAKNSYGQVIDLSLDECRNLSQKNNRMELSMYQRQQPSNQYESAEPVKPSTNEDIIYGTSTL